MGGNNDFFLNFERNKYLKKSPSMQRVKPEHKQTYKYLTLSTSSEFSKGKQ